MTSYTLALLLQASLATVPQESYAAAHKLQAETGRPLVVLVGTDWCPACRQMKETIIPQARRRGLFKRVAFAVVNADRERTLAKRIMRGGSIPQLVMFERTPQGGWKRTQLTGAQGMDELASFIEKATTVAETDTTRR